MWWAIAWPLLFAGWVFGFTFFAGCYHRCRAPARQSLRWVSWLSVAACGLIVVVSLRAWIDWADLHFRGIPARAEVVSMEEEYDSILERSVTRVIYQFEAEAGGQRRQFRREAELPGRGIMVSGFVDVLHAPADPEHSRMIQEFRGARFGMASAAVFLVLGVATFLLGRRRAWSSPSASGAVPSLRRPG